MKNNDFTHFADRVAEVLRKAAIEVEEMDLQFALGKAEAKDKYEELKSEFNDFVQESKRKLDAGKEKADEIRAQLEELRVQLALGKAETLDAFREQKKKILREVNALETKIKTNDTLSNMYAYILIEIEMFKVRLEILEDKFEEKKEVSKEAFERGKQEFNRAVEGIKTTFSAKEEEKGRWDEFQSEISQAFDHLKAAIKSV